MVIAIPYNTRLHTCHAPSFVCDGPVLDPLPAPDFCISASGLARTASRHPRYQRLGIGYRQHLCALHSAWRMEAKCLARWIYQSSRTPTYAASADTPGTYPFVDSQAGKPCYQICHGRSLTTTRIVVMMFFSQKKCFAFKRTQQRYIQLGHARHLLHYLYCSQQLLRPPQAI